MERRLKRSHEWRRMELRRGLGRMGCLVLLKVIFIFGLTKVPFGDYFLFFLGFLSKSTDVSGASLLFVLV